MAKSIFPKTIAIIGAGGRGNGFGGLINQFNTLGKVVAVAEPREVYRSAFAERHQIAPDRVFKNWQEFCAQPRLCDAVVISTMDRDHIGPAVACLKKKYDVLLEKPMAVSLDDCRAIERAQRQSRSIMGVCHSMRYNKGFCKLKELIDQGAIGRIMTLDQLEQVAYWHQAHSFVRGNWGNQDRSTFMLLAKSCHDIDFIAYLVGVPCRRVSSFGHLSHFTPANAPAGSTARCTDGCAAERTCPYSALKQYVYGDRNSWPGNVVSFEHSAEAHMEAIRKGPYGRCVYRVDNNVVDHQVVLMEFDKDITATFTMTAFTQSGGRKLRVHGDKGEIEYDEKRIVLKTFADLNTTTFEIGPEPGGHGGGDTRVMEEWLTALHTRNDALIVANAQESLRTHTIVFAAEKSRLEKRMVEIKELAH